MDVNEGYMLNTACYNLNVFSYSDILTLGNVDENKKPNSHKTPLVQFKIRPHAAVGIYTSPGVISDQQPV